MRDDALPVARIVFIGGGIALGVATAIVIVLAILSARHVPVGGQAVDKPRQSGSDLPVLQSAPQTDLAAWRQEKSRALNRLGWVDAASGVAHVPIDVAMGMLVERAGGTARADASRALVGLAAAQAGHADSPPSDVAQPGPQTRSSGAATGERR
jgi:hypothetical protein